MKIEDVFYINEKDWYKLQAWATLAHKEDENEISGLMTAIPQEDGRFKLGDVQILKQENTSHNTELNSNSVTEYTMKYGIKYANPDMKFVWWHSHHTMAAFWSGTDEKEINAWKNSSFSLALVINLREEYKFRVSVWKANGLPMEQHYDTHLTIERKEPKINITDIMKQNYKELCSNQLQTTNRYLTYNHVNNNINQRHLWQREQSLEHEKSYDEALNQAGKMQDSLVDGTMKMKKYYKEIKEFNKVCKKEKLPFRHIIFKEHNSHQLCAKLMTIMPEELFEWDDNNIKDQYETIAWNNSFGGHY